MVKYTHLQTLLTLIWCPNGGALIWLCWLALTGIKLRRRPCKFCPPLFPVHRQNQKPMILHVYYSSKEAYAAFHLGLHCLLKYLFTGTVKPVLSCHSKIDKTKILMTDGSLMKVKRIAECLEHSAILLTISG